MRPPLLSMHLAGALAVGACAPADAPAVTAFVRDSAGVRIVESAAPAWSQDDALALSAEPVLAIGDEEAGAEYRFGWVLAASRLSDGRIAVFDVMGDELRLYAADGRFLSRSGRSGGGPGEYRNVHWVHRIGGDSLLVHDMSARRLTLLAPDGTVARTTTLDAPLGATPAERPEVRDGRVVLPNVERRQPIAPFADGSVLARVEGRPTANDGSVVRDPTTFLRLAPDGTLLDTVGVFPGDERQVISEVGARGAFRVSIERPPFGRTTEIAVDGDGFWLGTTDRYEIARYDRDGRLRLVVRRPVPAPTITDADVEVERRRALGATPASAASPALAAVRRMAEARWERAVLPETWPAHGMLMAGGGRLWVREIPRPADDSTPRWTAFRSDGVMLGTVALPTRFRVLEFGAEHVLGVRRDDLDVQRVELYALVPRNAGRRR